MYHATQRSSHGGTIREWYDDYKRYLPAEPPPAELPGGASAPPSSAKELAKEMAKEAVATSSIASAAQLAKALFVASMLVEIERRAEARIHLPQTASIMWNDPAYRKERERCLAQADAVWRARWMVWTL
jgi:hypothetical protein